MNEVRITDALLREFLLGGLAVDEREQIETLFLTNSQVRESVLIAEQDLIEDYLEDNLTETDKERFLAFHAQTSEQRQKLRITKSIKEKALKAPSESPAHAVTFSLWTWIRKGLPGRVVVVPIVAIIVVAIVLGIFWLNRRGEQREHLAVAQELDRLNSPASLREIPQQMVSLELRPVTVRSVEPQVEFHPRAETRIVELRLPWIQKQRYPTYQAEVRRLDDSESVSIRSLQGESDVQMIRMRLPADMLRRGHYQIRLTGIDAEGNPGFSEEYAFAVAG